MRPFSYSVSMASLLTLGILATSAAFARGSYNEDYMILRHEEIGQEETIQAVKSALQVPAHNAEVGRLQTRLAELEKERQNLTGQIMEVKKKELGLNQTLNALKRQRRNNGYKISDLEIKLQRLE